MKRILFSTCIIGIVCTISFLACKKNKPGNISFTSAYDFTADIPAMNVPMDTTITVSSAISITDPRLENCDRATLKSFYLEIKSPPGQTFNFSKEFHLFFSAPGIDETEVASVTNIDPSAVRIDFTVDDKDLAQYLHQKTITVKTKIGVRKGSTAAIKLYGNMTFNVQAKLQ